MVTVRDMLIFAVGSLFGVGVWAVTDIIRDTHGPAAPHTERVPANVPPGAFVDDCDTGTAPQTDEKRDVKEIVHEIYQGAQDASIPGIDEDAYADEIIAAVRAHDGERFSKEQLERIDYAIRDNYITHGMNANKQIREQILARLGLAKEPTPEERVTVDMLRAKGWSVATHNDYRMGGVSYTFWLFTKDGRAIKGEGRTDDAAINSAEIVAALAKEPK
jgi:hypothetical protein